MKAKILELKNLYDSGITQKIFLDLVSHSTNGAKEYQSQYSNDLQLKDWKDLYSKPYVEIPVDEHQLELFFNYMVKYFGNYFGRGQNTYYVTKSLTNDKKSEDNFPFEMTLLLAFEIL